MCKGYFRVLLAWDEYVWFSKLIQQGEPVDEMQHSQKSLAIPCQESTNPSEPGALNSELSGVRGWRIARANALVHKRELEDRLSRDKCLRPLSSREGFAAFM